jgi:hypothetical protein
MCALAEKGCSRIVSPLTIMVPAADAKSSVVQVLKDMIVAK